jgi:hypothetical protein
MPVAAREELCISYVSSEEAYEERAAKLSSLGFRCACPRCALCQREPEVARLEREVKALHERAVECAMKMHPFANLAACADKAMPPKHRKALRAALEALPLEGQWPLLYPPAHDVTVCSTRCCSSRHILDSLSDS